ncbi:Protein ZC21.6, isoform b [Aphelenchoides besseyi]|nr:Protein ZC21.6, isoform b [Aphelenchoides besseyi]
MANLTMLQLHSARFETSPFPTNWTSCSRDIQNKIYDYNASKNSLANNTIPTLSLFLSSIAIIVNTLFGYLVVYGLRKKILPFRGYSLMLNRSLTDLLVSILTVIFIALHRFSEVNEPELSDEGENKTAFEVVYIIPHGRTLFTLLLTLDYWAVAGAYGVLAFLPFVAVKYPWIYRTKITNRRTVMIMIIVWILGAIYSILVVCLSSNNVFNVFNGHNDLLHWTVSKEDYVLSISNLVILSLAFILVTFSYVATMIFLWRKSGTKGYASVHFTSIKRMALNICAFVATCIVMASFVALPLFLKSHIQELEKLSTMALWTTYAMTGWALRMILDPITTFFLDDRFKKVFKRGICCLNGSNDKSIPSGRSTIAPVQANPNYMPPHSMISEFVQKCAELHVTPLSVSGQYFRFRQPTFIEPSVNERRARNHVRFDDLVC